MTPINIIDSFCNHVYHLFYEPENIILRKGSLASSGCQGIHGMIKVRIFNIWDF